MNLDPQLLRVIAAVPSEYPRPIDWAAVRRAAKAFEPMLAGPDGAMQTPTRPVAAA